jgi:hypothetical protein
LAVLISGSFYLIRPISECAVQVFSVFASLFAAGPYPGPGVSFSCDWLADLTLMSLGASHRGELDLFVREFVVFGQGAFADSFRANQIRGESASVVETYLG